MIKLLTGDIRNEMVHVAKGGRVVRWDLMKNPDGLKHGEEVFTRATEMENKRCIDLVKNAQRIVFSCNPVTTISSGNESRQLDPPFAKSIFEPLCPGGSISLGTLGARPIIVFLAMAVEEVAPRIFNIYALYWNDQKGFPPQSALAYLPGVSSLRCGVFGDTPLLWLELLHSGAWGVEEVHELPPGRVPKGEKKKAAIRRIIRIVPRKEVATTEPAFGGKPIDWSHRWTVRGHWRKHDGLGKDRGGEYTVAGHTWVVDHVKGPEEAPLIHKTRLVVGGSGG